MPLTMSVLGKSLLIKKIGGNPPTRKFLASLGFVTGTVVSVISETGGNLIVQVKDSRIAISRCMAEKIFI